MADEKENEDVTENETPAEEPVAEAAEEAVAEAPAEDAGAATEEAVEAPVAEAPAKEEPATDAPAADEASEEPAAEASGDEPAAETEGEAKAAPAAQSGPKPKKKRLPRSQRPQRTRPKRATSTERKPIVRLEKPEHERGRRQERQGTVVSDAMEKTIVVKVEVVKAHPKYKKVVRRSVKFHAHDEASTAKVGDVVRIVETRPLSKTKRWRLAEVVEAAK
jgi:small subunit ribosomal protein S17